MALVAAMQVMAGGPSLASGRDAAIEAAIDEAVAGWRPVFNCMVLEPEGHGLHIKYWQEDRAALLAALDREGVSRDVSGRIMAKTDPAAMETMTKGTAQELVAYCRSNSNWLRDYYEFRIPSLTLSIKKVLEAQ